MHYNKTLKYVVQLDHYIFLKNKSDIISWLNKNIGLRFTSSTGIIWNIAVSSSSNLYYQDPFNPPVNKVYFKNKEDAELFDMKWSYNERSIIDIKQYT